MSGETTKKEIECDEHNNDHPNQLQCDNLEDSTFSDITNALPSTPEDGGAHFQPVQMGLPPTPPSWQLKIPDKALMDEGYDSDFQVGPFVQDGVDEEAFVCMDEEALKKPEPILLPAAKLKILMLYVMLP